MLQLVEASFYAPGPSSSMRTSFPGAVTKMVTEMVSKTSVES
jgi:hypothetical protein